MMVFSCWFGLLFFSQFEISNSHLKVGVWSGCFLFPMDMDYTKLQSLLKSSACATRLWVDQPTNLHHRPPSSPYLISSLIVFFFFPLLSSTSILIWRPFSINIRILFNLQNAIYMSNFYN